MLPWNRNKTIEGSEGVCSWGFERHADLAYTSTIFVVLLATAVESLPVRLDDNITLPVVTSLRAN